MSSLPTPPRLGLRVPLPPPPKEGGAAEGERDGLAPGDVLEGRYQIEDRIGEGGVGFVYRALQLKLHRRVAVKLLQRDMVGDEELRPRFEREAITLAALSHPNIVSIQDYGMVRGQPFLVMELLEGRTLREMLDVGGAMEPLRALQITRQLVHALVYAHELGIVHRDLKPANLIVQQLPAFEHLKVLDFGLAKLLPGSYLDRGVQLSRVGFTFGTPPYMSPEHATGGAVDGRSDLYSVGILLFEMLTGGKPFDGELHEVIRHHLSTPVPRLVERKSELGGRDDLQLIVERCMAKARDARFATAVELLRAVEEAILNCSRPGVPAAGAQPAAEAAEPAAPTEVRREALALVTTSGRLGLAMWHWCKVVVLPWIQQRTAGMRGSIEQLGQKTEEKARESWRAAKPRMEQAKQQLAKAAEEAKAKLRVSKAPAALPVGEASEESGASPGASEGTSGAASASPATSGAASAPPATSGGGSAPPATRAGESAPPATKAAARPAAADASMSADMTNVLSAPKRDASMSGDMTNVLPAPKRDASMSGDMTNVLPAPKRSIEQDATLDLASHERKQFDPDATQVEDP